MKNGVSVSSEFQFPLTVGEIADYLSERPNRVAYMITKLRLKAVRRCGIIRLFSKEQVKVIKEGLYNIQLRA